MTLPISLRVMSKHLEFGRTPPQCAWFPELRSWAKASQTSSRVSPLLGTEMDTPKPALKLPVLRIGGPRINRPLLVQSCLEMALPRSQSWRPAGMESQSTALGASFPGAPARHVISNGALRSSSSILGRKAEGLARQAPQEAAAHAICNTAKHELACLCLQQSRPHSPSQKSELAHESTGESFADPAAGAGWPSWVFTGIGHSSSDRRLRALLERR